MGNVHTVSSTPSTSATCSTDKCLHRMNSSSEVGVKGGWQLTRFLELTDPAQQCLEGGHLHA